MISVSAIVAQLVEQTPCKRPVVGSNPINGSITKAGIAQLVEHLVAIQKVASSSLVSRSILKGVTYGYRRYS